MLKKFLLDKTNVTKNALSFFSELKRKVDLSITVCGFSIFDSVSFLLKFIFLFTKEYGRFDFKTS